MDKLMFLTMVNLHKEFMKFLKGLGFVILFMMICALCIYMISIHPQLSGIISMVLIATGLIWSVVLKAYAEAKLSIKREEKIKKGNERIKEYYDKKQEEMIAKHRNSLTQEGVNNE